MKQYLIILLAITILAAVLRLYKLDSNPPGLYQDETSIAYNAFSIRTTGNDEFGRKFPVYFESFGDWKLPVYIYATAISQNIFGMNSFSVRFPSALFGILTIFVFFYFVKEVANNPSLALISTLFLSITPWHIHYSRATFEVSIVLFLLVSGTYLLLRALKHKHHGAFTIGTLCFIISIYTYNLTRLLSPVLYAGIIILNWKKKNNITPVEYGIAGLISLLVLVPFVMTFLSDGGAASATGTLIFSSAAVQAPLLEFRSYFVQYGLLNRLVFNTITLTTWQYVQNIASYFSVPFFFLNGSSHGNHGIATTGQFYVFELPLMIIAAIVLIKNHAKLFFAITFPAIVTILVAALTRENPHATRSYTILMTTPILSAYGVIVLVEWIQKKSQLQKTIAFLLSIGIIGFSLILYGASYAIRFPIAYASQWRTADRDVGLYLKLNESKYKKILIDTDAGFIYSSLLYYTNFTPALFQRTVVRLPEDSEGFSEVVSFDKYEYKKINWETDYVRPDTLIITTIKDTPPGIPTLVNFVYPSRPVVVASKQQIISYPTQDSAYVAIQSHP